MEKKILTEISARHMHVTKEHLEILFGSGAELTHKKDLSQPGQFACEERVKVSGAKGELTLSILGPTRPATQVEISLSDARSLGITAPVRESGDVDGSAAITLIGPRGSVELEQGVIVAKRHIHLNIEEAAQYGLSDKQVVKVEAKTNGRSLIFGDVVVRVNPNFSAAMHIDTDEANAAGISGVFYGEII